MGRFSNLERETQDALVRQKALGEKKESESPVKDEVYDAPYYINQADEAYFGGNFKDGLKFYSRAMLTVFPRISFKGRRSTN